MARLMSLHQDIPHHQQTEATCLIESDDWEQKILIDLKYWGVEAVILETCHPG